MKGFSLPRKSTLREFPRVTTVRITITVATTKDDAVADLAHALSSDIVNAAVAHGVAARLDNLRIDGLSLKRFDNLERKLRKAGR